MGNVCNLFIGLLLLASCASDKPKEPQASETPKTPAVASVTGIRDSVLVLSDQTTAIIPHFNDSAYTVLFCVRHAEKADDGTKNPPLTAEGQVRAARLGDLLSGTRIDRIGSSNLKRNLQTAEAVQRNAGEPDLEVFAPELVYEWAQDLLIKAPGQHVLYVGHSNTVPELLNRLTGSGLYADIPESDYTRFYVVVSKGLGESAVLEFRF